MKKYLPLLTLPILLFGFLFFPLGHAATPPIRGVSVVVDSELGPPARHGLQQLTAALEGKELRVTRRRSLAEADSDRVIVLGTAAGSRTVRQLAQSSGLRLPGAAEALLIQHVSHRGQDVLLVSGADDRGLMYAALEIAERIRLAAKEADPLAGIENASEKPDVPFRSVARMFMNRSVVEEYFYSEDYWNKYLNMLAKNRYNNFTLMLGYGAAGYFEPPYPFLFKVPEFPQIQVVGMTEDQQHHNFQMLQRIIQMTHDRGLEFTVALWTHLFVPGHNNYLGDGFQLKPGFPTGLTEKNLVPYTKAALRQFLEKFPGIDRIQFRVHVESSVNLPQQQQFWREIFEVIEKTRPELPIDMRAKGFSDDLIQVALDSPLQVRIATKQWGEELGLPFHPTQDSLANKYKRRHSYADLLVYPKRYNILWRLWAHGTVKVLLWGDPDHARRFAQSTRLYQGDGFEVHEPLAMKMGYKRALHDVEPYPVLSEKYRHYDWEFERYWHFYQVFGRTGYNFDTSERVWRDEFQQRFGEAAPFVQQAYSLGSKVLPRIVAYATRNLSAGYSWPEKRRWEDLPEYIHVRPSDTAQFLGIDEAARLKLAGKTSAKIWPEQNSRWFENTSREIFQAIKQAERLGRSSENKEFLATMVDMKVLAYLAAYHAQRIHAGMNLALFEESGDLNALLNAIRYEQSAIDEWQKIVNVTTGVYPDNIIMGRAPDMEGNWATELDALKEGLADLKKKRKMFRPKHRQIAARLDFGDGPAEKGFIRVTSRDHYSLAKGGYGWHHVFALPSPTSTSKPARKGELSDFIRGPEGDEYTYSAFGIDLPDGHYELLFSMADLTAEAIDHGPMWIAAEGETSTEWIKVPAGQVVEKKLEVPVVDGRLDLVFNSTTNGDWIINSVIVTRIEPSIAHVPIRGSSGDRDLPIRITSAGPDPLKSVELTYGSAQSGYKHVPMKASGPFTYAASLPRSDLLDGTEYFIEVTDRSGRRALFPREGANDPIRIRVKQDQEAPAVTHPKIRKWEAGRPLIIEAQVDDPSGVESVFVRYRGISQHQDFHRLRLLPTGNGNTYRAEIPRKDLDARWDFMYLIEAFDRYGNGRIYPDLDQETPYVVVSLHESADVSSDR